VSNYTEKQWNKITNVADQGDDENMDELDEA